MFDRKNVYASTYRPLAVLVSSPDQYDVRIIAVNSIIYVYRRRLYSPDVDYTVYSDNRYVILVWGRGRIKTLAAILFLTKLCALFRNLCIYDDDDVNPIL